MAEAEGLSSCYRKVHWTFLPNFCGFALKFGATSSSPLYFIKTKNGYLSVTVLTLAGAEGLEPSARGFGENAVQ